MLYKGYFYKRRKKRGNAYIGEHKHNLFVKKGQAERMAKATVPTVRKE